MKTNKSFLRLIGFLALVVVAGWTASGWAYEVVKNRGNGVSIQVKPNSLAVNAPATFSIELSTHSVELDQDFTVIAELKDDQGRSYSPVKWDGSPPGGHHRSGTLTFPALKESAGSVTLILRDVAKVPERSFSWKLK